MTGADAHDEQLRTGSYDGGAAALSVRLPDAADSVPVLERLRQAVDAAHVSVLVEAPAGAALEVRHVSGRSLLTAGVALPTAGAADVIDALDSGRPTSLDVVRSETPFTRFLQICGMEAALVVPLAGSDDGRSRSGLLAAWETQRPEVDAAVTIFAQEQDALAALARRRRAAGPAVIVCHEDPILAHGIARNAELNLGADVETCRTAQRLSELVAGGRADAILCSDTLSDDITTVARLARMAGSAAPLVMLARTATPRSAEDALAAGAAGYATLADGPEHIVAVVAAVLDGRAVLPPLATEPPAQALTARELEVLRRFGQGLSDTEISLELKVAVSTVKTHARQIFRKLGVSSRTAALHRARSQSLL